MLIVFGIRHFNIKSYQASEFGLIDPSWSNTRFEAVQRYFHIMYIPFFPVGKMIGTRGKDGQLYHLDPRVAAHISTYQLKHKTLWYTFLAPILFVIGLVALTISGMVKDAKYKRIVEKENARYTANALAMIDHPSLHDYYQFTIDTTGGENGYVSHQVYGVYRVIGFNDKAIQFRTADESPFSELISSDYEGWVEHFEDTAGFKTFWLQKADLKKTILPPGKESYDYDGAKVSIDDRPCYIVLEKAHVVDGPEFEAFFDSYSSKGSASLRFDNIGETATDISFTKLSGEGDWTLNADEVITPTTVFHLITKSGGNSDNFSCRINCKGLDGREHVFLVSPDAEEDGYRPMVVKKIK